MYFHSSEFHSVGLASPFGFHSTTYIIVLQLKRNADVCRVIRGDSFDRRGRRRPGATDPRFWAGVQPLVDVREDRWAGAMSGVAAGRGLPHCFHSKAAQ